MVDAELLATYLNGNCSVFAVSLARRTGWDIVAVGRESERGWPRHFACRRPDGLFADARGLELTVDELVARYAEDGSAMLVSDVEEAAVVSRFKRDPERYQACAADHLDRLLPELDEALSPAMAM